MADTKKEIPTTLRVAIAGAGGIGGYFTKFYYDFGFNRRQFPVTKWTTDIYDDDLVDASNLLHQNYTEDDLGRPKAEVVAAQTLGVINPVLRFMTADDFPNYDVVFSCVDSMRFRAQLYRHGFEHKAPYWIDGRCSSRSIGVFASSMAKRSLESVLNEEDIRGGCLLEADKLSRTSHITPVIVAGMMMQVFLNHLRGEDTPSPMVLYL
jgi:ThiF family